VRIGDDSGIRTRVYVDGYNLYYGCLKNTPYKWLDLRALMQRVLLNIPYEQNGDVIQYRFCEPNVKFFTAPILAAFARSADSVSCQATYHDALRGHLGTAIEIVSGLHAARRARAYEWIEGVRARDSRRVAIWKLEEKQSDVALALHAYSDAIRGEVEQVIAVTNDSDFAPAMKMIREHTPAILGLIAPARRKTARVNAELGRYAHWVRVRRHRARERLDTIELEPCAGAGIGHG
jgi:6-hydroxy-3-succinoylpyridine 3-monooxygenase